MEGVSAGEVEIAGSPEKEPEDVAELLQSPNKTWTNKLLLYSLENFIELTLQMGMYTSTSTVGTDMEVTQKFKAGNVHINQLLHSWACT